MLKIDRGFKKGESIEDLKSGGLSAGVQSMSPLQKIRHAF